MEHSARGHGGRENQPQVVGQEERRERRHDPAESQERQKGQKQPRQSEAQQVIAEVREPPKLLRQPERAAEDRARDSKTEGAEERRAHPVAALPSPRPVARGPDGRRQQIRKRPRERHPDPLTHDANPVYTTSSISCRPLPPVSRRNTSVSCAMRPL